MSGSFVQRKIIQPIKDVLSTGITPHKLALSIALGAAGGLFPVPGVTTLVCFALIFLFGVNPVIVQVVNLVLTPVDVAMIPLFMFVGGWIFRDNAAQNFSVDTFMAELSLNTFDTLLKFQTSLLYGIVAWLVLSPILVLAIYVICFPVFKQVLPRIKEQ